MKTYSCPDVISGWASAETGVCGKMIKMIRIGALFSLLFLFPTCLSAELNSFQFRIIKTAFMNGYVRAIKSEDRLIKQLRENRQIMEKVVMDEAEKYMQEVSVLNKKIQNQKILKASADTFQRNNHW